MRNHLGSGFRWFVLKNRLKSGQVHNVGFRATLFNPSFRVITCFSVLKSAFHFVSFAMQSLANLAYLRNLN